MPPKSKNSEKSASNNITIDDVTLVAANSVTGFLTNVSKGVRRAHAEGGKGTRRRVELYISTDNAANTVPKTYIKEDNKENVILPNSNLAELTDLVEEDWEGEGFIDEGDEGNWEDFDLDVTMGSESDAAKIAPPTVKPDDTIKIDTSGQTDVTFRSVPKLEPVAGADSDSSMPAPMVYGITTRDPAYDQMIADHQAAVAHARSLRLTALRRNINQLAAQIIRGVMLNRAANHTELQQALLGDTAQSENLVRGTFNNFQNAVQSILSTSSVGKTHAPSWITPEKEGTNSALGKAVHAFVGELAAKAFSFDNKRWAEVHIDQRHSPTKLADLVQLISANQSNNDNQPAQTSTGAKRPRETGEVVTFSHPADYVLVILCLLRSAGVPSRLVVASESPSTATPATTVVIPDEADELGESTTDTTLAAQSSEVILVSKKPSESEKVCSYYWIELWDPHRQAVVSLNPIPSLTTRFGAPYTFAFDSPSLPEVSSESGDTSSGSHTTETVTDVSVRYVTKYSQIFFRRLDKWAKAYKHLLWPDAFGSSKDYLLDRRYGPVEHIMRKMQDLLEGRYSFEKKVGVEGPPSDAELERIVTVLNDTETDATVFGSAPECSADDDTNVSQNVTNVGSATGVVVTKAPLWGVDNAREQIQLEKLLYAEPVPTTLADVKNHPLYVMEKDLQRHEAVYPKDKSTMMGTIRGAFVYKRAAIVALRSRDGWLREGRSLTNDDTQPYRVVPPPPSRPLAPASKFYGYWQTKPFEPVDLTPSGHIPRHGNTNWYMLLGALPPPSLVHINKQLAASVARRVAIEFRQAIVGFDKKEWTGPSANFGGKGKGGGGYEARSEGIIIRASDLEKFETAHAEYLALLQEQEAKRRSLRARNWWNAFSQRLLANDRVQLLFRQGNAY